MKLQDKIIVANAILDHLNTTPGKFRRTTSLTAHVNSLGHKYGNVEVRSVCYALHKRNTLERTGTGRYAWKANVNEWDRDNPLRTRGTSNEKPPVVTSPSTSVTYARLPDRTWGLRILTSEWERGIVKSGDTVRVTRKSDGTTNVECVGELVNIGKGYRLFSRGEVPQQEEKESTTTHEVRVEVDTKAVDELRKELEDLRKQVKILDQTRKTEIVITHPDKKQVVLKGDIHYAFEQIMFHVKCGDNVMMVGPKGCGKSQLAYAVAKAMKLQCSLLSMSGGVTESKLFGRLTPNVNKGTQVYMRPEFVQFYEEGGVFLLDEIDAADPNVLTALNGALEENSRKMPIERPNKPIAERHDKFVCLAAANTWGNGGDRQYCGRNQQDAAAFERFVQIDIDYDKTLEMKLATRICPGCESMVEQMHKYREAVYSNRLERTVTTRFICRAAKWMKHGKDLDYVGMMLFKGWREDEIRKVKTAV